MRVPSTFAAMTVMAIGVVIVAPALVAQQTDPTGAAAIQKDLVPAPNAATTVAVASKKAAEPMRLTTKSEHAAQEIAFDGIGCNADQIAAVVIRTDPHIARQHATRLFRAP